MTNKEAIAILENLKTQGEVLFSRRLALDLAIKALEERPQGEWEDYNGDFYKCPECGYLLNKLCPQCHNKVVLPKDGGDTQGGSKE